MKNTNGILDVFKLGLIVVVSVFVFSSVTSYQVLGQQMINASETKDDNYRIGPGDVIDIFISKNETLSRTGVRVSNQGMIQLVMVDADIQAACRTEKELADQIREKYKKYLINPHVIVAVKEFNSTPVTLLGEVISPKQFQLQRPMRLLEVLTLGNGPTTKAGPTIQIIRNPEAHNCQQKLTTIETAESSQLVTFDLNAVLKGDELSNPFIKAGDVVRVVEAEEAKKVNAYIVGNVQRAMTIDLKDPVTLTQAVAMAGGTTSGAQLDKIKISRQVPGSLNKTQLLINLKEINKRNEGDIYLEPNDIIDIPGPSGSKKFLKDIFKTIIPAVTRLPVPLM